MEYRYQIFNKCVLFKFDHINPTGEKALLEQLSVYNSSTEEPDIYINISDTPLEDDIKLQNPSIHKEVENGFIIEEQKYSIRFQKLGSKLHISIYLKPQGGSVIRYLKKLNNIEYASLEERLPQIIWEQALINSIYFDPHLALIHSSGFIREDGKTLLLGGTGGVGKTSLELELCRNQNFCFLNDDIAVVSKDNRVHPNLAFPKIYSYNLTGNSELKESILNDKPLHDRFAWNFKKMIWGPSKVRRKVNPEELYGSYAKSSIPLNQHIMLIKGDFPKLSLEEVSAEDTTKMTLEVIKAELFIFNNHLSWHLYNCLASGSTPICDPYKVWERWENIYKNIFSQTDNYILKIPSNLSHKEFLSDASKLIVNL